MKYLIIGDGIAGATAAETIREQDKEAEIKVFTDEKEPLYNRIMLKSYMKGDLPGKRFTKVHDTDWYEKRDIDLHLETEITGVEASENSVKTADGNTFSYDKLLIATGGSPRRLPQDQGYENLHYMWTIEQAEEIKNAAEKSENSVVIGGGLLGIDLAIAFAENGSQTYYLIREDNWWHRGLDQEGAEIIHKKLEEKGCKVVTNSEVTELETDSGKVEAVIDNNGEKFSVDTVAVAIGQEPNSGIVNVEKNSSGMIKTDEYLQTSDSDIYAAGNMVEYQSPIFEKRICKGSWDHSEAMGETAGANMVKDLEGEEKNSFNYVNTYGVGHFNSQFLAIGDWTGEAVSKKYNEEDHYRRLFFNKGRIVGAVMIGYTAGQEKIREAIKNKKNPEEKEEFMES